MTELISAPATSQRTGWFKCTRPNPAADLRIFCFPYAGGNSAIFRNWAAMLGPNFEVQAVQLPGRESRFGEPAYRQLDRLIPALALALEPYLDKPFVFFGHSMGALISFELARFVRSPYRVSPEQLFVAAFPAPQQYNPPVRLHQLPEVEFIEALRHFNGTPEQVLQNQELMRLVLPTLRADFALCETYSYREGHPLECPISVYGGYQDTAIKPALLAGWEAQTSDKFRLKMLEGDHFFIQQNQAQLLQDLAWQLT